MIDAKKSLTEISLEASRYYKDITVAQGLKGCHEFGGAITRRRSPYFCISLLRAMKLRHK